MNRRSKLQNKEKPLDNQDNAPVSWKRMNDQVEKLDYSLDLPKYTSSLQDVVYKQRKVDLSGKESFET